MIDGKIRHAILDLATEDYMPLWVLVRSIRPAQTEDTIRRVVRDMLWDGTLNMLRFDDSKDEEIPVADAKELEALLLDTVNWWPSTKSPRVMISPTDAGLREYFGCIPERNDTGTRWRNPATGGADEVRVMPGNPSDPTPVKRGPYVRVRKDGVESEPIPLAGNPELAS